MIFKIKTGFRANHFMVLDKKTAPYFFTLGPPKIVTHEKDHCFFINRTGVFCFQL
jgi:hypothetical protein